MKLTQIIKKLESEYGWSFYDDNKKLHITEMQKELILDVARVVEQNCNKHGVSGKRPLDDIIRQAVDMAREEAPWLSTQPMYTLEQIQAACASGAVDKTVSDGIANKNTYIKS